MGFFRRHIFKGTCKAMLRSYRAAKRDNPQMPKAQLYAEALSSRPAWERINTTAFRFKSGEMLNTAEAESFQDVVRNVILIETLPVGASQDPDFLVENMTELTEVMEKQFEGFQE